MARRGENWVRNVWYGDSAIYLPLLPLSWLYGAVTSVRRWFYRLGIFRAHGIGAPVIVVGNITVGGTGKTPIAVLLAQEFRGRGYVPGIVSRGYRGSVGSSPMMVTSDSDPSIVGDEPVLLAARGACPVAVHPDRVAAARLLVDAGVDLVIADDGLQHYRLARRAEIAVVDGRRLWGNQRLLPAGPLRESVARLDDVDMVLVQTDNEKSAVPTLQNETPVIAFNLRPLEICSLNGAELLPLDAFSGKRVHAVAAIGNPDRFFETLTALGMDVVRHAFPDHATLTTADLTFGDQNDVIMTEKDAVKCRGLDMQCLWYVPVEAEISGFEVGSVIDRIENLIRSGEESNHG